MLAFATLTLFALVTTDQRIVTTSGAAEERPSPGTTGAQRPTPRVSAPERCPDARSAVAHYRGRYRSHLAVRGVETSWPVGRKPRGCADAHYLAEVWTTRAFRARQAAEKYLTVDERRTWLGAIAEVQAMYPGTSWWLQSCSRSEGAGRSLDAPFVMNHQDSGAGGWLQFMSGTFWRMFTAAKADVEARGFKVPDKLASWYSRAGQALAGAWGLTNGRRHEWSGAGC